MDHVITSAASNHHQILMIAGIIFVVGIVATLIGLDGDATALIPGILFLILGSVGLFMSFHNPDNSPRDETVASAFGLHMLDPFGAHKNDQNDYYKNDRKDVYKDCVITSKKIDSGHYSSSMSCLKDGKRVAMKTAK